MTKTKISTNGIDKARDTELRRLLTARRQELQLDIGPRLRDERAGRTGDVLDDLEQSDAANLEDLDLRLVQMRKDTVARIDQALRRLDAGEYGECLDCEKDIAEVRLRALPFAVRCKACEGVREQEEQDARRLAQRQRGTPVLFAGAGH